MARIIGAQPITPPEEEEAGHICSYCGEKIYNEYAVHLYKQGCDIWACEECEETFWIEEVREEYLADNTEE